MQNNADSISRPHAFQLSLLQTEALALMDRATIFGPQSLRAPERRAATARSAARLARIWAWANARRSGDAARAAQALRDVAPGPLDRMYRRPTDSLGLDVDALAERAMRLEALYESAPSADQPRKDAMRLAAAHREMPQ
ncbi:MAG: hypothetical protein MRY74_08790 [Neomegalonema sp.]|nr:hypothetical protein [Neomegalonema sp.]